MNSDLEERLTASMRRTAGGMEVSGDVLDRATRNHRRRTLMIRVGYGLGVTGVGGAVALGLTISGTGDANRIDPGPPPAVQAQPPSLRLANAAVASDNISYRMRLRTGTPEGTGLATYEGAFDPKTDTGYCRSPHDDAILTEILIEGTKYVGGERPDGKPPRSGPGETYGRYGQYEGKHDRLSIYAAPDGDVLSAASPDPAALFRALKEANATTTQNPDGTLHFEYGTQDQFGSTATSGDVTLNADGRIAKVVMTTDWQTTVKGRLDSGTVIATLELFDYGVEVKVERPKDVVPFKE
ncbi:MAG TPA: hypothetical protein VF062_25105 [Candidatus Limnocylindrales bacterium]